MLLPCFYQLNSVRHSCRLFKCNYADFFVTVCDGVLLFLFAQCVRIMTELLGLRVRCGTALCAVAVSSGVWRTVVWFLWSPSAVMNQLRSVRERENTPWTSWRKESAVPRRSVVQAYKHTNPSETGHHPGTFDVLFLIYYELESTNL